MAAAGSKIIALLCPLKVEARLLPDAITVYKRVPLGERDLYCGRFHHKELRVIVSGMGSAAMEETIRDLLAYERPHIMLNFGACGGLAPDLQVGEALISRRAVAYLEEPPALYPADSGIVEKAVKMGIREGVIASADKNVDSPASRGLLRESYSALGCDWESAPFLKKAARERIPAAALRLVSDVGEKGVTAEFRENIDRVVTKGTASLLELIKRL